MTTQAKRDEKLCALRCSGTLDATLRSLRDEAGRFGDHEQVRLCDIALLGNGHRGYDEAVDACMAVLLEAEAEMESDLSA